MIKVGEYTELFNDLLNRHFDLLDIMMSDGLRIHMVRRGHLDCLTYIDQIEDIISNPTYIGINPATEGTSFELIKNFGEKVLVGIKLDVSGTYYYVSTMYTVQTSKINRRLNSGRIKPV